MRVLRVSRPPVLATDFAEACLFGAVVAVGYRTIFGDGDWFYWGSLGFVSMLVDSVQTRRRRRRLRRELRARYGYVDDEADEAGRVVDGVGDESAHVVG